MITAASLRIDADDWAFVFARELDRSFGVDLQHAPARVETVGELYDLILHRAGASEEGLDPEALAFDALLAALLPYGVPREAGPGLRLGELGLPRPKALRSILRHATGLALPGLPLGWVGCVGMVMATLVPFVAWRLGHWWLGIPAILLGLALARGDPGSWSGEWRTLGGLARSTAALNEYVLMGRGARRSPAAVWSRLTTFLSGWSHVPVAEISRDTRLLA